MTPALTVRDVAARLKVSTAAVYITLPQAAALYPGVLTVHALRKAISTRRLRYWPIGARHFTTPEALEEYLCALAVQPGHISNLEPTPPGRKPTASGTAGSAEAAARAIAKKLMNASPTTSRRSAKSQDANVVSIKSR